MVKLLEKCPAILLANVPEKFVKVAERTYNAVARAYTMKASSTSTTHWADEWEAEGDKNNKEFNKFLYIADQLQLIITTTDGNRNWSELEFNESTLLKHYTQKDILEYRLSVKIGKYKQGAEESTKSNLTKQNGKVRDTGLVREGLMMAGNTDYGFDKEAIVKYITPLKEVMHKGIKLTKTKWGVLKDPIDYEVICNQTINHLLLDKHNYYTLGARYNDSRGRDISLTQKSVFNPINNKFARASLQFDARRLSTNGLKMVFQFIAELHGTKVDSITTKESIGIDLYNNRTMIDTEEAKDQYENLWLDRIYSALDMHFADPDYKWDIPIEIDGTASMIQIEGSLLDHTPFLDGTNCLYGDYDGKEYKLEDIWSKTSVPRNMFKVPLTQILYGSSQSIPSIWKKKKMEFTRLQAATISKELRTGDFSVAVKFKDFIINNCTPKETMEVQIFDEKFTIECNKWSNVGDYQKSYTLFDSSSSSLVTINHTFTKKVPNLQAFKRYFVTLLVHNLDSQVCDYVCKTLRLDGKQIIPIYDAFILHPNDVLKAKEAYTEYMDRIYDNRSSILANYFNSIGIGPKAIKEWKEIKAKCKPLPSGYRCSLTALK